MTFLQIPGPEEMLASRSVAWERNAAAYLTGQAASWPQITFQQGDASWYSVAFFPILYSSGVDSALDYVMVVYSGLPVQFVRASNVEADYKTSQLLPSDGAQRTLINNFHQFGMTPQETQNFFGKYGSMLAPTSYLTVLPAKVLKNSGFGQAATRTNIDGQSFQAAFFAVLAGLMPAFYTGADNFLINPNDLERKIKIIEAANSRIRSEVFAFFVTQMATVPATFTTVNSVGQLAGGRGLYYHLQTLPRMPMMVLSISLAAKAATYDPTAVQQARTYSKALNTLSSNDLNQLWTATMNDVPVTVKDISTGGNANIDQQAKATNSNAWTALSRIPYNPSSFQRVLAVLSSYQMPRTPDQLAAYANNKDALEKAWGVSGAIAGNVNRLAAMLTLLSTATFRAGVNNPGGNIFARQSARTNPMLLRMQQLNYAQPQQQATPFNAHVVTYAVPAPQQQQQQQNVGGFNAPAPGQFTPTVVTTSAMQGPFGQQSQQAPPQPGGQLDAAPLSPEEILEANNALAILNQQLGGGGNNSTSATFHVGNPVDQDEGQPQVNTTSAGEMYASATGLSKAGFHHTGRAAAERAHANQGRAAGTKRGNGRGGGKHGNGRPSLF